MALEERAGSSGSESADATITGPSQSIQTLPSTVTDVDSGSQEDVLESIQAAQHGAELMPEIPVSAEQLDYLRTHVKAAEHLDEATLRRFVRATGGNLPLSAKRLAATLAWRAEVRPESIVCRACAKNPRSHYMHISGFCKRGRPIIYSCLELAGNKVFSDNRDHMIQTFEMAVKCMPQGVEQWIWVCDFKGFGIADCNPKLAKLFLDISAEHYPERLGLFMIVDAPSLFGVLWRAIKNFVDPKTYQKIRFLPYDWHGEAADAKPSSLKAELDTHFDAATSGWLLREMAENRDKAKAAKKVYNMYSIFERAQAGELCTEHCHGHAMGTHLGTAGTPHCGHGQVHHAHHRSASAAAAELPAAHDPQGTPALLHAYSEQPDLLLPQATAVA